MQTLVGMLNVLTQPSAPQKAKFEFITTHKADASFEDIRAQLRSRKRELEKQRDKMKAELNEMFVNANKLAIELDKINRALNNINHL
jgi:malate synthase